MTNLIKTDHNRLRAILLFPVATLLLLACDSPRSQNQISDKPAEEVQLNVVDIDTVTENRYVYIKNHFVNNDGHFIEVDFVDYLTGREAAEAEWRDEAYYVSGEDTISNITDGYYISNVNPKLRTFRIYDDAQIENIIDDDGPHEMHENKTLDSAQFESYIRDETLVFLHIHEGVILSIDERFMP